MAFYENTHAFVKQDPPTCKDSLLHTRNICCPSLLFKETSRLHVPLINVGQKSKFLGELPGSDVMADVAGHKPAWEATVSQRAGYGALPTGRGWPPPSPPTCCCCCCPTLVTLQPAVRQTSSQKLQPLLWREKQVLHPHWLIAVGWTFDRCGF